MIRCDGTGAKKEQMIDPKAKKFNCAVAKQIKAGLIQQFKF